MASAATRGPRSKRIYDLRRSAISITVKDHASNFAVVGYS